MLVDHVTPALPAPFDPGAVDGSSNPLYSLWFPLGDTNYDAAIFVPGSVQRDPAELIYQGIANRAMQLPAGNANCYGYLDVGNDAVGATDIILAIEKTVHRSVPLRSPPAAARMASLALWRRRISWRATATHCAPRNRIIPHRPVYR